MTGSFGAYFGNSVLISVLCVVCMVILASTVRYALARIRFWGKGVVTTVLLLGLTIPVTAIILPLYSIMRNLGLLMLSGRFTNDYGLLSAGVIIVSLPVIVLFLLIQRNFVEGLASGS